MNKKTIFTALLIFAFSLKTENSGTMNHKPDWDPISEIESFDEIVKEDIVDYFHSLIATYNPNADKSTTEFILYAMENYGLNKTKKITLWSFYQILLESSGFHKKDGVIIESYAGALGITQITIPTAYDYMVNIMNKQEKEHFVNLGGTLIDTNSEEAKKTSRHISNETRKKVKIWLENEQNAILLWAFIMSKNIEKYGYINALVIYNAGLGGWKKIGIAPEKHSYIQGIKKVERFLSNKKRQP